MKKSIKARAKYFKLIGIICVSFLFLVSSPLKGAISGNDISGAFPPASADSESTVGQLETMMIDGASLFFQSYGAANLLLSEGELFEKGDFTASSSLSYVEEALYKLELSKKKYEEVYRLTQNMDYVETKVTQLKNFNYVKFATENDLNIEIMDEVAGFLKKGDVKGYYRKNLDNIELILSKLGSIKSQLNSGVKPEITLFWEILRLYSYNSLLGNYSTVVAREAFKTN
jgi:hypothetical protein